MPYYEIILKSIRVAEDNSTFICADREIDYFAIEDKWEEKLRHFIGRENVWLINAEIVL